MSTKQKVEPTSRPAFIRVSEDQQDGIIQKIECEYTIIAAIKSEDEMYYKFYIPAFGIYYFSDDEKDAERMADAAVSTFFDYWIKNRGKDAFINQIKKLGFVLEKPNVKPKKQIRFSISKPSIPPAYNKGDFFTAKKTYLAAA